mmetsp:Transcript_11320/g.37100  ORF Transcript_11320/g.37100 Transcript_11320/m.37100 type:complete len:313 (+) Transcript_11320:1632-2570(+)
MAHLARRRRRWHRRRREAADAPPPPPLGRGRLRRPRPRDGPRCRLAGPPLWRLDGALARNARRRRDPGQPAGRGHADAARGSARCRRLGGGPPPRLLAPRHRLCRSVVVRADQLVGRANRCCGGRRRRGRLLGRGPAHREARRPGRPLARRRSARPRAPPRLRRQTHRARAGHRPAAPLARRRGAAAGQRGPPVLPAGPARRRRARRRAAWPLRAVRPASNLVANRRLLSPLPALARRHAAVRRLAHLWRRVALWARPLLLAAAVRPPPPLLGRPPANRRGQRVGGCLEPFLTRAQPHGASLCRRRLPAGRA